MTDRADATEFKIADTTDRGNILMKRESLIKCHTQVAHCLRRNDRTVIELDRARYLIRRKKPTGTDEDQFSFIII